MSNDSSNASAKRTPRDWGIPASLVVYAMALLAPGYVLLPFVALAVQALPVDDNVRVSLLQIAFVLAEFGIVLLALLGFGKRARDIGLGRFNWRQAIKAVPAYVAYVAISVVLIQLATWYFHLNADQPQNLGYSTLHNNWLDIIVAFVPLILLTPVVEETLFRGFIFQGFRNKLPFWAAALGVSALFGLAHGQWNVGLDVFALSMVSCYLREQTHSLWPSVLLHLLKNSVAFYLLYLYNGG